jgi:RNA polymerase sigma-70 factor (ECF subfamily)
MSPGPTSPGPELASGRSTRGVGVPDPESVDWLRGLRSAGSELSEAQRRLHGMLLRVAQVEVRRRAGVIGVCGVEVDDVAQQAADDALFTIMAKLDDFRGESRFTTWAYKFAVFEAANKVGRHFWQRRAVAMDDEDWERLPERFGVEPVDALAGRDLLAAIHASVRQSLSARQRQVFVGVVVNAVPVDVLAAELGTNRNSIYKSMFDARRKIRAFLVANGHQVDGRGSADAGRMVSECGRPGRPSSSRSVVGDLNEMR